MRFPSITRTKTAASVAVMSALAAGAVVAAPAAQADATGCASNVCIYLAGNAGGSITVQGWARNDDFTGTLTVSGPNGFNYGSPDQTWYGSKGNFMSWSENSAPAGQYCVTGTDDSTGYQGTACETLS